MPAGPLAYQSRHAPFPLSEEEEACLTFAAGGITGFALLDLPFAEGQGGAIVARSLGRTIASGDAIQTVSLVVINDDGTYLIKRPQDFPAQEIAALVEQANKKDFTALYQRLRVKIKDGRAAPPVAPMFNVNVNRWSLYAPGTSYFLPINELTFMYINGLLEIFNEHSGAFVVDERAGFRAAGLGRFARSKGGHLCDDPSDGRVLTVQRLELMVSELVTAEQGMMLQNLGLICQAMGLGGFPNFAEHEFSWFEALSFRMGAMPASKYLGANIFTREVMRLLGRNQAIRYALGLERDGDDFAPALLSAVLPEHERSRARRRGSEVWRARPVPRRRGAQRLARPGGDCQGRTGNQFRRGRRDHCLLRIHSRSLRSLSRTTCRLFARCSAFKPAISTASSTSASTAPRRFPKANARTWISGTAARAHYSSIHFLTAHRIGVHSPRRRLRPSAVRPYDTIDYCKNIWRSRWNRYPMR